MADNIRRPARARMWKRIAIILASVSTVALVVFVILSFLPQGNAAFTIRIDDPTFNIDQGDNHFHMSLDSTPGSKDEGRYIRGESLQSMVPTTAANVEKHIRATKQGEGGLTQQQNYVDLTEPDLTLRKGYALVYTVYLVNDSAEKDQNLKYSVNLDSYVEVQNNSASLIDYFRVLIRTETVEEDETNNPDNSDVKYTYYGEMHNNEKNLYKNSIAKDGGDEADYYRESISTYERKLWDDVDGDSSSSESSSVIPESSEKSEESSKSDEDKYYFKSTYNSKGNNDGYCHNFSKYSEENKSIVNGEKLTIKAGTTLRFTYAAYFEGADIDCIGQIPKNSYLLLSLHFGL